MSRDYPIEILFISLKKAQCLELNTKDHFLLTVVPSKNPHWPCFWVKLNLILTPGFQPPEE